MARRADIPTVPAEPFSRWLSAQYDEYEKQDANASACDQDVALGPAQRLAEEIGWGSDDAGIRRLYRYRKQVIERTASSRGVRWTETADSWPRDAVEDACHRVHPDLFLDLYPELRFERDVVLEPDAYCPFCEELVTPIDGLCPWCVCEHGHLFREVGITDDGFACLACLKKERREREKARLAAKKLEAA